MRCRLRAKLKSILPSCLLATLILYVVAVHWTGDSNSPHSKQVGGRFSTRPDATRRIIPRHDQPVSPRRTANFRRPDIITGPTCFDGNIALILVTSKPSHFDRRKTIRETWAKPRTEIQTVFMVGVSANASTNADVHKEAHRRQDVLLGGYLDTYRNLTTKVLTGLSWADTVCRPRYIVKTDDDCFVNTRVLLRFLERHNERETKLYVGGVHQDAERRQPIREPDSKWYVPYSQYRPRLYPKYSSGTGYVISVDLIGQILEIAPYWAPFPVEDAYIGHVLNVLGVRANHSHRFTLQSDNWQSCNFLYLMVIHGVLGERLYRMERMAREAPGKCRGMTEITEWD